jgi:TetR/AcrR family tetracycline transcriptional repressor
MKPGLTKMMIVDAALEVLDESGIDGLTVRAVAARLHVQAPALYWHVRDKQELRDEMATEMWRRIGQQLAVLPDELSWKEQMAAFATLTRRTILSIRDGSKVFAGSYLTDPGVLKNQEQNLQMMVGIGFTLENVIHAFSLLYSFVIGFCIEEQSVEQLTRAGDDRYSAQARRDRVDDGEHPMVAASGPQIFDSYDERFELLVGIIVDAADRMRGPAT